ncbi:MAG: ribokinase [Granulosicoccus sp.]|nr:ribokinase [Granulosicoccus sp.]
MNKQTTSAQGKIAVLGVFVADASYRASRQPVMGETVLGSEFSLGPGGKGSNQAVAAARCGAQVSMVTRLGADEFANMALELWGSEKITPCVEQLSESYTGSAYIFIDEKTGDNAIIICPGAAATISAAFVDQYSQPIKDADIFLTQLEQPVDAAIRALQIAREANTRTIFNPAPAEPVDDSIFALCDYVTPNETETEAFTGMTVNTIDEARAAADVLLKKGVGTAVITLGEQGVLLHSAAFSEHVPAFHAGPVVETTGAGDAFNGGFATALAQGEHPLDAARFGCAVAGLSVTRRGAAASMPQLAEARALLSS